MEPKMIVKTELKSKAELNQYITSIQPQKTVILENISSKDFEDLLRKKILKIDKRTRVLIISR
jgi:hypothetical protein